MLAPVAPAVGVDEERSNEAAPLEGSRRGFATTAALVQFARRQVRTAGGDGAAEVDENIEQERLRRASADSRGQTRVDFGHLHDWIFGRLQG